MRRPAALLDRLRSPARAEPVTWFAIFAMLVQMLLGGPAALSMTTGMAGAIAVGSPSLDPARALCSAAHADGTRPTDRGAPAKQHHEHDHCIICSGALGPVLLAAWIFVASEPIRAADAPLPSSGKPQPPPSLAYASRAPPLAA
jgi:hypothetical protein